MHLLFFARTPLKPSECKQHASAFRIPSLGVPAAHVYPWLVLSLVLSPVALLSKSFLLQRGAVRSCPQSQPVFQHSHFRAKHIQGNPQTRAKQVEHRVYFPFVFLFQGPRLKNGGVKQSQQYPSPKRTILFECLLNGPPPPLPVFYGQTSRIRDPGDAGGALLRGLQRRSAVHAGHHQAIRGHSGVSVF